MLLTDYERCRGSVNRSLGVHVSFVRSIAMDSWTDKQLALMKNGGNDKCNDYLKKHGIDARTPIKQKYESPHAQLYKEVLKARVEGRPEPTELPPPLVKKPYVSSAPSSGGSTDTSGMERLVGETDQQYIARQTRLREEARARMAAKFGGSQRMGGAGSNGSSMQGIGSNPNYNPNTGGYSGVDSVVSGLGNAFSFAASIVNDPSTKQQLSGLTSSVKNTGVGFWNGLSSTVQNAAQAVVQPTDDDGLEELRREFQAKKSTTGSMYAGFGSDSVAPRSNGFQGGSAAGSLGSEAPGLPGEDRNGIGRLTGETDQQYMARQTRLKEEAKARMAAKFGGSGLGGVGSGMSSVSQSRPTSSSNGFQPSSVAGSMGEAPGLPGEDRNGIGRLTGESDEQYIARQTRIRDEAKARMAAKFGGSTMGGVGSGMSSTSQPPSSRGFGGVAPAPSSGSHVGRFATPQRSMTPQSTGSTTPPRKEVSSDDFFASFGT
jgi:Putative GTPase activating protein for Arf